MKKLLFLFVFIPQVVFSQNFGNAINFDGVDDYIIANAPTNLISILNTNFTIEMWVNPNNTTVSKLYFIQEDVSHYVNIMLTSNNVPCMYVSTAGIVYPFKGAQSIPNNTWSHLAFTWDKNTNQGKIYINGVDNTTIGSGGSTTQVNNTMSIGAQSDNSLYYKGSIDELRFWDHKRSICEIKEYMHRELTSYANLICYYQFNDGINGGDNSNLTTVSEFTGTFISNINNMALNGSTSNFIDSDVTYSNHSQFHFSSSSASNCLTYTWTNGNGQTYYTSTQAIHTLAGQAYTGCDSTIVLDITIHPSYLDTITEFGCKEFTWTNGTGLTYTTDTLVTINLSSIYSCDSTVTLKLSIINIDSTISYANNELSVNETADTYQWIDCDTQLPIAGATLSSFTPTENGNYAVIITENGCSSQLECIAIYNVGINENSKSNWKLFPNPSSGKFYISGTQGNDVNIDVLNIEGKVISSFAMDLDTKEIDLSNYPTGIYILKLNDGSHFKLVKQ